MMNNLINIVESFIGKPRKLVAETHELIFDFAGPKYYEDDEMYTWWMAFDESTKVEQHFMNFQYVRSQNMVNIRVIVTRDLK